jgi:hypothetical protein
MNPSQDTFCEEMLPVQVVCRLPKGHDGRHYAIEGRDGYRRIGVCPCTLSYDEVNLALEKAA